MRILNELPKIQNRGLGKRGKRRSKFDELEVGKVYLFVRGEDFQAKEASFISNVHTYARSRGYKAHVRKTDEGVAVQFYIPSPENTDQADNNLDEVNVESIL